MLILLTCKNVSSVDAWKGAERVLTSIFFVSFFHIEFISPECHGLSDYDVFETDSEKSDSEQQISKTGYVEVRIKNLVWLKALQILKKAFHDNILTYILLVFTWT